MRLDEFEQTLQKELSWRKKEISELLLYSKQTPQEVLLKSLILLIYAHWEGFIKKSSKLYLKYISDQNLKIGLLTQNFRAISLKTQIGKCLEAKESLTLGNELVFINTYSKKQNAKFKLNINIENEQDNAIINTKSNLSPKIFKNILNILGINYKDTFKLKEEYFNKNLLNNRNQIGHGGETLSTIPRLSVDI